MEEATQVRRLSKAAKELNVGIQTIVDFLHKKGFIIEKDPNTKISLDMYALLIKEYQADIKVKEEAKKIGLDYTHKESISIDDQVSFKKEQESEFDQEDLFLKTAAAAYGKEAKTTKAKTVEKEKTGAAPKVVDKIAIEEPVKPAEEPKKEPEILEIAISEKPESEKKLAKADKAKKETKVATPEVDHEIVETPVLTEESLAEPSLKILGKIDLETLKPKGKVAKKGKEEKRKGKEKAEEATSPAKPEEVAGPPAIVTEVESLIEEQVEIIAKEEAVTGIIEPEPEVEPSEAAKEVNFMPTEFVKLEGPVILGKIDLPAEKKAAEKKPVASSSDERLKAKKKKRKRIKKQLTPVEPDSDEFTSERPKIKTKERSRYKKEPQKIELSEEDIQKQIKETLARLSAPSKSKAAKYRRMKRDAISQQMQEEQLKIEEEKKTLKVTEFVTANDLAVMMNAAVTDVISTCMTLGMMVSINQRLDAETLVLVAEEFGYKVEFVSVEVQEAISDLEEQDDQGDLSFRPPIVTVMGHVDHGKTLLLDYIRKANVVAGEAGGITQHIGAYEVKLENGKSITFLDTPGHEAFTAMRARGAKITDVAIIIIAADDAVMPQTVEAINHAQAAGVPMVFAINKIDKPNANPEKIREQLSQMNILVEEWGGKYQCQEISAKKGLNIELLLEKVLLEAELLELKANPNKKASGTVIESSLDKGRGYIAKILVQNGTLWIGDFILAGSVFGRVKAMYNERNQAIKTAGPSTPLLLLGLTGAPQAGDLFNVMSDEKEAKAIASKRQQLQREQGLRTQKHITLDEIGRRIAIGDFKELNIIVKGDVDGSIEALSDSLLKLSTEQVLVSVIHKSVGPVTESDVLLASASNAIIVAFQVRPSMKARKLAEQEQIDIRLYSIIYNAINEIKSAIEGMLAPEIEEKITCNLEIREVFKITKVGTIAGCIVLDGKINRNSKIRVIRDGIVVYTGTLGSLKRFKDDAKEVTMGLECGLNIENFNDIKVGDIIEGYEEIEVRKKL